MKYQGWEIERGSFAYEAYRRVSAGAPLPDWDDLSPEIQRVWIETADAVCRHFGAIY